MAKSVNFVWNYLNDLSYRAIKEHNKFLSSYDVHPYTRGSGGELGLHSQTLQAVASEFVARRNQFHKAKLSWRKSQGSRRSLGWVPMPSGRAVIWSNGQVYHNGHYFKVWDHCDIGSYKWLSSSFNEDSRGRWYFNVAVEVETTESASELSVGIDLGLKDVATCSDGTKLANHRFYRSSEVELAAAQRAGKKARVRAIHAKIKNQRKDALHKFSRSLVNRCGAIYVGDVSSTKLVKTKMAKSVLDAGWGMLKTMLSYKCAHAGLVFKVVDESYTTQTCSSCGSLPESRPRGIAGLGIREWTCSDCGVSHDRDVNAAKNILALGSGRLAEGRTSP